MLKLNHLKQKNLIVKENVEKNVQLSVHQMMNATSSKVLLVAQVLAVHQVQLVHKVSPVLKVKLVRQVPPDLQVVLDPKVPPVSVSIINLKFLKQR